MKNRLNISLIATALACVLLTVAAISAPRNPGDTDAAARRVERITGSRLKRLESYVGKAPRRLPSDMVIYRYEGDTLSSWDGLFPIVNDNISTHFSFHGLVNPRANILSPFSSLGEQTEFVNLGPKWYLVKMVRPDENTKVVIGLEILDSQASGSFNGANPRLRLGDSYSIKPLKFSEGSAVYVDGTPVFKVLYDSLDVEASSDTVLMWIALLLFIVAAVVFLAAKPGMRRFALSLSSIFAACSALFLWGRGSSLTQSLFSPLIYADGNFFYSIGAILIINIALVASVICLFLVRGVIYGKTKSRTGYFLLAGGFSVYAAVFCVYSFYALRSIALNSNISLEINKVSQISPYTVLVLGSFVVLLSCVPVMIHLMQPSMSRISGRHFSPLSPLPRLLFSLATAAYLVALTSVMGFRKEQSRLDGLENRLAVERNIGLEIQLRRTEFRIAKDPIITTLVSFEQPGNVVLGRIAEVYLARIAQDYELRLSDIHVPGQNEIPIAENSHFFYSLTPDCRAIYRGYFAYYVEGRGLHHLTFEIEPVAVNDKSGYASIFGLSSPGLVSVPRGYSYAKYSERELRHSSGTYAYSTHLSDSHYSQFYSSSSMTLVTGGYRHFITVPTDGELIIVSRPVNGLLGYLVSVLFFTSFTFATISVVPRRRRKAVLFQRSFYKRHIMLVVMLSLFLALAVISAVSIVFVYQRNEANMSAALSYKISSLKSTVQAAVRALGPDVAMNSQEVFRMLESVSDNTCADITLYSPRGSVMASSAPEVFERRLMSGRMDPDAFNAIVRDNRGYYFHKEKGRGVEFYAMYAPIFDSDGALTAILCSPNAADFYAFEEDVLKHFLAIFTFFVMLLFIAQFMLTDVVEKMFRPLGVMGRTMSGAVSGKLEHIRYDRDDEVSTLVSAYNRMVDDLKESTEQLAQNERDKAWSGMARQVAHEIKNPLTPMKLQIQRIIRLKAKGDPQWVEKFDEASGVLLDHIDILTQTANEFSDFAKLYTEEPAPLNLNSILEEEIAMFDNKEGVEFEYIGLKEAVVMGPKPQLTRVFVNLVTNAVQALGEGGGKIRIELRNSTKDGYYDIVFADSGPGVEEENIPRLFVPNFTTKNGGSGLGLAISRSVLEKCGAKISYSRDYLLGGACFTITYPKN